MRKPVLLGAGLLLGLLVGVPAAGAAPAAANPPTCLIADGPHFTKTLICAGLVDIGPDQAGHGSYAPGISGANAELTVTVESQRDSGGWDVLADNTVSGQGRLDTSTEPVRPHGPGSLRACVTVTVVAPGNGHPVTHALCSVGNPDAFASAR